MSPRAAGRWTVPALVATALIVRLAGLRWGLPDATHFFSYHPDEFSVAGTVNGMLNTGDLNPRFFHYGSATIYLTWLLTWPFHAAGIATTVVGTHVIARLLTILLGVSTVALTWRIGARAQDQRAGTVAAAFLAMMPGHVLHSGFATVDVPAAFFVAACLLLSLRAAESPVPRRFLIAGMLAGFAAATKYNAGIVALAPLVAAASAGRPVRSRWRLGAVVAGAAIVAFLVATPYALLDFADFRSDVAFELFEHSRSGHGDVFRGTGNGWWYHLTTNLPYLTGIPLALLAGWGLVRMGRERRPADRILLAFAVPYFLTLGFSEVRFLRYLLPLAPVLAVAGARAMPAGVATGRWRVVLGGVLLFTAALTLRQQAVFAGEDPRTRAARWLDRAAAPGTSVGLIGIPWYYSAPVTPWNGGPDMVERFLSYERQRGRYRFVLCEGWDLQTMRAERPDVFVVSEFERRDAERLGLPEARAFLDALRTDYRVAAEFDAFPPSQRRMFGPEFAPHDWLYPFAGVTVWRRARAAAR